MSSPRKESQPRWRTKENDSKEHFKQTQCQPKLHGHVVNIQALLKRPIVRTEPCPVHLNARERMLVPGWFPPSPSCDGTESRRTHQKQPLASHLPSLQVRRKSHPGRQSESELLSPNATRSHSPTVDPAPMYFSCVEELGSDDVYSPSDAVRIIHANPHLGFLQMMPEMPKSSIKYDPYRLKLVKMHQVKGNDFVTVYPHGVMVVWNNQREFLTLERWEKDYGSHCKVLSIPFFAHLKTWKPFYLWRAVVRFKKIAMAKKFLSQNLFVVNESLSLALIEIREMCHHIADLSLFHMEINHTYKLQEFKDVQFKQLAKVSSDLRNFQNLVKEVTICACRTTILDAGFTHDDQNSQHKIKNIEMITRRRMATRLSCFIHLVDYLVSSTMHMLVVNSVARQLAVLQEQVKRIPSHDMIRRGTQPEIIAWSDEDEVDRKSVKSENSSGNIPRQPMFISELMLDTNSLKYQPSEEDFQDTVAEIIGRAQKTVLSVDCLGSDPDFDQFTQLVGERTAEKKFEDGSCLESILENDSHLQTIIQNITESIHFTFDSAKVYSHMFEHFRLFYKENKSLDLDALQEPDHDLSFFSKTLEVYHNERKEATAILQNRCLGLLLVDTTQLKEQLISSIVSHLEFINNMLTLQAKGKVDAIIAEASEAEFKLEFIPSTTVEIVNSLVFLDEIQERMKVIKEQQEMVGEMYHLIKVYSVPVPPEDLAVFATLQSSINSLHNTIDRAAARRDSSMERFCNSLQKDIKELNSEVMEIKLKSQDPQILDINTTSTEVRLILTEIQISLREMQARASTYSTYQTIFKVEVTKFEALEKLRADVEVIFLLWDCLENWDSLLEGWRQTALDQLDLEVLSSEVNKYSKQIMQLEKGLPRNNVLPCLKEKVEVIKQRLPVITDLCNPYMRPRHWEILESFIGANLSMRQHTLAELEDLNTFSYGSQIQQLSGQATGEAALS